MSTILSQNNPVSVQLGSIIYDNVKTFAMKVQGVGGGDMVSSQTVANVHSGVSFTDHPKEVVAVFTVDAVNVEQTLISNNYVNLNGANVALGTFVYKRCNGSGQTQTVSFTGSRCKVKTCELKIVNVEGSSGGTNPVTEIEVICQDSITYSGWT